jgi:hypothetical protein
VTVGAGGIAVSGVTVLSSSQLQATFIIAPEPASERAM